MHFKYGTKVQLLLVDNPFNHAYGTIRRRDDLVGTYQIEFEGSYKSDSWYKANCIVEDRRHSAVIGHRPMLLSEDAKERKGIPMTTGVLDYFPLALAEVAKASKAGNEQHNPGQPLHWDKTKSTDHADCILRHLVDRGKVGHDGVRHSANVAWRALALLQLEMEAEQTKGI